MRARDSRSLECLVVQDIFLTETAYLADIVLPASAWPEKTGTVTNTDRMVQLGRRALDMPGDARQDLWIIQQIANRLGCNWNYTGPESGVAQVYDEMRRAMNSITGITWERLEAQSSVTYPCRTEDDPGQPIVFTENFPTQDGRGEVRSRRPHSRERASRQGLSVRAHHRAPAGALAHGLDDAARFGARCDRAACGGIDASAGSRCARREARATCSRSHRAAARSRSTARADDGTPRGERSSFPFAFYEAAANLLTNAALDPFGKIAEVKYCAVTVRKGGDAAATSRRTAAASRTRASVARSTRRRRPCVKFASASSAASPPRRCSWRALASAQQWPAKPVKIISVFPPGGSVDQVARVLAQQLQTQLGQTFIVENRGGAAGSIGTQVVATSPPDGYTFGVVFDTHAVNPLLIPNLSFDTLKDLAPVMLVGTSPMAIVTQANQPYKDFRDVIAAAKARPGTLSMGSIGTGSLGHLALAQIDKSLAHRHHAHSLSRRRPVDGRRRRRAGAARDRLGVPRDAAREGRQVEGPRGDVAQARARSFPARHPLADQGMPGFSALSWWGIIAPANTPQPIIRKMVEELGKALKDPGVAQKLTAQGIDIDGGGPEALDKFVRGEMARWEKVVKENNIRAGD